jgi:hypothetical protein
MPTTRINQLFVTNIVQKERLTNVSNISLKFSELLEYLEATVPSDRYLAIVKTKLEEACFFAKRGYANIAGNSDPQFDSPIE